MNVSRYRVVKGQPQQIPSVGTQGEGVYVPFNGDPSTTPRIQFYPFDPDELPCPPEEFGGFYMSVEDMEEIA